VYRREWFTKVAGYLPKHRLAGFAGELVKADYHTVTRGEGVEYFYLYPIKSYKGENLLVISRNIPGLAFFDDAGRSILIIGLIALSAVILVHLVLYRLIFAPFRKLHEQAVRAGGNLADGPVDAASVVAEYERIIEELKANRAELERLNDEISERADSLEEFNQYLLRSIDSGMITLAIDGRVQIINESAGRILRVDPQDQRYRTYAEVFQSCPTLSENVAQALDEDELPGYREYTVPVAHGEEAVIGVTFSRIRGRKKTRLGLSLLLTDLTELAQLRLEVETRNRLASLGEMAGGLAHQIRNALGVISGYGRLVRKQLEKLHQPNEATVALLQETGEAEEMISQFLNFARPLELNLRVVEIGAFLRDIARSYSVRSAAAPVNVVCDETLHCEAHLDPLLFKQAIVNLIDNAVNSYEESRGTVTIAARNSDNGVNISVSDSGSGIALDERERIFTPFYSSRASGTGLGLPLVKKIIDLHSGRIRVDSAPGRGTTFNIWVPLERIPQLSSGFDSH
jgi:signal transduction histidine kinase